MPIGRFIDIMLWRRFLILTGKEDEKISGLYSRNERHKTFLCMELLFSIIMGMKNMKRIDNYVGLTSRLDEILTIVTGNHVPFLVVYNRRCGA